MKDELLAIIPARAGSKRVLNKNVRLFNGKPLIYYTIKQALDCKIFNRIIVDTDSPEIAGFAKKNGADVPFLRPRHLATGTSRIVDSVFYLLSRLKKEEGYAPSHVALLQVTSPLREIEDIKKCLRLMKSSGATSVVTACAIRPKPKDLLWLKNGKTIPANLIEGPGGSGLYGCNGMVFLVKTGALFSEKKIITQGAKALVCPEWRSIDIDTPEEWALSELLFKNKPKITKIINSLSQIGTAKSYAYDENKK